MEYQVRLKNPFSRDQVVALLQGRQIGFPLFGPEILSRPYLPATAVSLSPTVLPSLQQLSQPPVYENFDFALYLLSCKGGAEKDYYLFDSRCLIYDRRTRWAYWDVASDKGPITQQDLVETAKALNIEVEIMMAIAKQESHGGGFFRDGKPKILFERHKMYQHLKNEGCSVKELEKAHPDIVNHKSGGYGLESRQHQRLKEAKKLDEEAAIMSASWGRFQVMGETYKDLYNTPQELEQAMNVSEKEQLKYFAAFVKKKAGGRLLIALRSKQWETVATLYNGTKWREKNPNYVRNIKKYYSQFKNK